MWAYKDQALTNRLRMNPTIGFIVDYWLLLHADDGYPVWRSRPLSLRSLAQAIVNGRDSRVTGGFAEQLVIESRSLAEIVASLGLSLSPVGNPQRRSPFDPSVVRAAESILESPPRVMRQALVSAVVRAAGAGDLVATARWMRHLSAAMGERLWSNNQLFVLGQDHLCNSGAFDDGSFDQDAIATVLNQIATEPPEVTWYVSLPVTDVALPAAVLKNRWQTPGASTTELDYETVPTSKRAPDEPGRRLRGLNFTVDAVHPQEAARKAIVAAQTVFDLLRLKFHVRPYLAGPTTVRRQGDRTRYEVPLPQPFWQAQARRKRPELPAHFDVVGRTLSPRRRAGWHAAGWHLSQAFASWPEDVHGAAARVWQAIEVFVGEANVAPATLTAGYLAKAPSNMLAFIANRFTQQAQYVHKTSPRAKWYGQDPRRQTSEQWLDMVLNHQHKRYWRKWSPSPQELLFHPSAGILPRLARRRQSPKAEPWMGDRLRGDLALLRAIRNAVVHEGRRILTIRMAEHVAAIGAEMLLDVMNSTAEDCLKELRPPGD